jgi:hypothetical protein
VKRGRGNTKVGSSWLICGDPVTCSIPLFEARRPRRSRSDRYGLDHQSQRGETGMRLRKGGPWLTEGGARLTRRGFWLTLSGHSSRALAAGFRGLREVATGREGCRLSDGDRHSSPNHPYGTGPRRAGAQSRSGWPAWPVGVRLAGRGLTPAPPGTPKAATNARALARKADARDAIG